MSDDFLPYSRQNIEEEDVEAVVQALRSPIISQGSRLETFENAFASLAGAKFAVGVSSGTAALHTMVAAAGLGPDDEVILPALTFASTANALIFVGAKPVFVDIDPGTLCLDPLLVERAVTPRTKAILAVDFAGHPADYRALRAVADNAGLLLLADSAHSAGGSYDGQPTGSVADLTAFSFNPVKNMTTAEGGMVTTNSPDFATRAVMFRTHGMTRDPNLLESEPPGGWYYEQQFLGFNYKLSELHAALGVGQLAKLASFNQRRAELAALYQDRLINMPIKSPSFDGNGLHTWHLFIIQLEDASKRTELFDVLRRSDLGVQVHYIPVPMHPYFSRLGYSMEGLPRTADYYRRALSLPLHPMMTVKHVDRVVGEVARYLKP
jgi:perosamine synthetase